ncbi:MAG: aspartate/glutamate racemase family protein [Motilibacteraceae bacterium]
MLRVRAITPIHVDAAELERRQRRYERLAPDGISVQLEDIGDAPEVPRALETEADVRRSEELVVAAARRTDPAAFDVVLPDCVLDPGVGEATDLPVPLVGLSRLCTHLLAGTGQPFAAVARNQAIADELARKVHSYGLSDSLVEVRVLSLSVQDIADDATWAAAITTAVGDLDVPAVVNGCSAVEVRPAGEGPAVLDPTATALQVLGLAGRLSLVPRQGVAAR